MKVLFILFISMVSAAEEDTIEDYFIIHVKQEAFIKNVTDLGTKIKDRIQALSQENPPLYKVVSHVAFLIVVMLLSIQSGLIMLITISHLLPFKASSLRHYNYGKAKRDIELGESHLW